MTHLTGQSLPVRTHRVKDIQPQIQKQQLIPYSRRIPHQFHVKPPGVFLTDLLSTTLVGN